VLKPRLLKIELVGARLLKKPSSSSGREKSPPCYCHAHFVPRNSEVATNELAISKKPSAKLEQVDSGLLFSDGERNKQPKSPVATTRAIGWFDQFWRETTEPRASAGCSRPFQRLQETPNPRLLRRDRVEECFSENHIAPIIARKKIAILSAFPTAARTPLSQRKE